MQHQNIPQPYTTAKPIIQRKNTTGKSLIVQKQIRPQSRSNTTANTTVQKNSTKSVLETSTWDPTVLPPTPRHPWLPSKEDRWNYSCRSWLRRKGPDSGACSPLSHVRGSKNSQEASLYVSSRVGGACPRNARGRIRILMN